MTRKQSPPGDSVRISLKPEKLGLEGTCDVRDLWAKKDIGKFKDVISLDVRNHGARLLRVCETK